MTIKEFSIRAKNWFRGNTSFSGRGGTATLDRDGMLDFNSRADDEAFHVDYSSDHQVLTCAEPVEQTPLEKFQDGFERLIDHLEGINHHLDEQLTQQQQLLNQLKENAGKADAFFDSVGTIAQQSTQQNQTLENIGTAMTANLENTTKTAHQVTRLNEGVESLVKDTATQADGILQLNRTLLTTQQQMQEMIARQNKKFFWTALAAASTVVLVISAIVAYAVL